MSAATVLIAAWMAVASARKGVMTVQQIAWKTVAVIVPLTASSVAVTGSNGERTGAAMALTDAWIVVVNGPIGDWTDAAGKSIESVTDAAPEVACAWQMRRRPRLDAGGPAPLSRERRT